MTHSRLLTRQAHGDDQQNATLTVEGFKWQRVSDEFGFQNVQLETRFACV